MKDILLLHKTTRAKFRVHHITVEQIGFCGKYVLTCSPEEVFYGIWDLQRSNELPNILLLVHMRTVSHHTLLNFLSKVIGTFD